MKKSIIELGILSLIGIGIFFGYFRNNTPYPYLVNWDLLHHTELIKQLVRGNFSFNLTKISDTFTVNSYTPLFHLIFAIPTMIFNINPLKVFWWAESIYFLFTIFAAYWIGQKILNYKFGGFITALVSMLIFESTAAYTTLFLLPLTLSGTIAALFLIDLITRKSFYLGRIVMSSIVVVTLHYMIGIVYITLLLIVSIMKRLHNGRLINNLTLLSVVFLFLSIIYNLLGKNLYVLQRPDAKYFTYSLPALGALFWQWYGILPLILMPLGIFKLRKNHNSGSTIVVLFLLLMTLIVFPFSYGLKLFVINHYLVSVIIAAGIIKVFGLLHNPWLKRVTLVLIFVGLGSVFVTNINQHLRLSFNGKENSYISDSDFSTARWIDEKYLGKKVFLISDPTSQGVFEALSHVNTQGGAFPKLETVILLNDINKKKDPAVIRSKLFSIHDSLLDQDKRDVTLFVTGGRYFAWQGYNWDCKISYACQVWLPLKIKLTDREYLKNISDSNLLKMVYVDNENVILELINK